MSCHVLLCHVMSYYAISCEAMSCHVLLCHVMSCHVMSCCLVMFCDVMSCHAMSCHVIDLTTSRHISYLPCHVVPHHGLLYNANLVISIYDSMSYYITVLLYNFRPHSITKRHMIQIIHPTYHNFIETS